MTPTRPPCGWVQSHPLQPPGQDRNPCQTPPVTEALYFALFREAHSPQIIPRLLCRDQLGQALPLTPVSSNFFFLRVLKLLVPTNSVPNLAEEALVLFPHRNVMVS